MFVNMATLNIPCRSLKLISHDLIKVDSFCQQMALNEAHTMGRGDSKVHNVYPVLQIIVPAALCISLMSECLLCQDQIMEP